MFAGRIGIRFTVLVGVKPLIIDVKPKRRTLLLVPTVRPKTKVA